MTVRLILPFFLLISFSFLTEPLTYFFSQDDFFHLRIIMDKNFTDVPSFYISALPDQTFYRPLSRETFNLVMYRIFGLNAYPFHLVNLILIFANILLTFLVIQKITSNNILAYFTTAIYGLSAIHSIELYYLASVQTLLATSLMLTAIYFYIRFIRENGLEKYLVSFLSYLLALFCHESAIVLPAILFVVEIYQFGFKLRLVSLIKHLSLFGILGLFQTFSIVTSSLPVQEVYKPVYSIDSIINTLGWYSLWSFNLPEMLVDFVGPDFSINPNFIKWYGQYVWIVLPMFIFTSASLIIISLRLKTKLFQGGFLFLFISCYTITILPFLFFPKHKFIYYLSFGAVWFSAILGYVLSLAWQRSRLMRILSIAVLITVSLISFQTTALNQITYWAAKRAVAAKSLLKSIHQNYPTVQSGTIFYIFDDPSYPEIARQWGTSSRQAAYILSGSDALKLFYNDSTIETYYQAADDLPKNINREKVINFMAKFPY